METGLRVPILMGWKHIHRASWILSGTRSLVTRYFGSMSTVCAFPLRSIGPSLGTKSLAASYHGVHLGMKVGSGAVPKARTGIHIPRVRENLKFRKPTTSSRPMTPRCTKPQVSVGVGDVGRIRFHQTKLADPRGGFIIWRVRPGGRCTRARYRNRE